MTRTSEMKIEWPSLEMLDSYAEALRQGWSPDTVRPQTALDELERIEQDPVLFIAQQVDLEAKGPPVTLKDGTVVARIPGYRRWMWDGEFCGSIGYRWVPGTTDLPPHVLGHIGYSVVPWKRRKGYATSALRQLIASLQDSGMPFVDLTTPVDNIASQHVIEANGGQLIGSFEKIAAHGGGDGLRYRIFLGRAPEQTSGETAARV